MRSKRPCQGTTCSISARNFSRLVRFFAVDGRRNARLASVFFADLPVASAVWAGGDGAEVVVTGRRRDV